MLYPFFQSKKMYKSVLLFIAIINLVFPLAGNANDKLYDYIVRWGKLKYIENKRINYDDLLLSDYQKLKIGETALLIDSYQFNPGDKMICSPEHKPRVKGSLWNKRFEEDDKELIYNEAGRVLILAKYWNIIYYFYWNIDRHEWENVLSEFIPIFMKEQSLPEFKLNFLKLVARTHDNHASYQCGGTSIGSGKKNIFFSYYDRVVQKDDSLFYKPDLKDLFLENVLKIKSINGIEKNKYIDSIGQINAYTHRSTLLRDVIVSACVTEKDSIVIQCENGSNIIYHPVAHINTPSSLLKNDSILYINYGEFDHSDAKEVDKIFNQPHNIKYVFIDLRYGSGKFQYRTLEKNFVKKNIKYSFWQEGFFYCNNTNTFQNEAYQKIKNVAGTYTGKIFILTNEVVQSNTESLCMSLKTNPNTKLIGRSTAGANGNIAKVYLPFQLKSGFSYVKYSYASGENYQGSGIKPDIEADISGVNNIEDLEKIIIKFRLYDR